MSCWAYPAIVEQLHIGIVHCISICIFRHIARPTQSADWFLFFSFWLALLEIFEQAGVGSIALDLRLLRHHHGAALADEVESLDYCRHCTMSGVSEELCGNSPTRVVVLSKSGSV